MSSSPPREGSAQKTTKGNGENAYREKFSGAASAGNSNQGGLSRRQGSSSDAIKDPKAAGSSSELPRRSSASHGVGSAATGGPNARRRVEVPSRFWIVVLIPIALSSIIAHQLYRWRNSQMILSHFPGFPLTGWDASRTARDSHEITSRIDKSTPPILWVKPETVTFKSMDLERVAIPGLPSKNESLMGTETLVQSPTGIIYSGTADGRFVEIFSPISFGGDIGDEWRYHTVAKLDRILGIHVVKIQYDDATKIASETVVACDATQALVEFRIERAWNPAELTWGMANSVTTISPLLPSIDGRPLAFCNSIVAVEDDEQEIHLVITDSSKSPLSLIEEEFLSEEGTGRVVLFHYSRFKKAPAGSQAEDFATTVLDGIHFANGVDLLSVDKAGKIATAIVAESMTRSLLEVTFNIRSGLLHTHRIAWSGLYHLDDIHPANPRRPRGWDTLPAIFPDTGVGLDDLYLIGIPNVAHSWQLAWLPYFRRFNAWIPLPIRISFVNPVLFSNSAVGIYSKKQQKFVALIKSKGSGLHSTAHGLLLHSWIDPVTGICDGEILFGTFSPHVPLSRSHLSFQLNHYRLKTD